MFLQVLFDRPCLYSWPSVLSGLLSTQWKCSPYESMIYCMQITMLIYANEFLIFLQVLFDRLGYLR